MSKENIVSFIKFGSRDNIIDLYNNGTIYCNTFDYFIKLEDGYLRGDKYEGTFKISNLPSGKIHLKLKGGNSLTANTKRFHLREYYTEIKGNLFCLTAVKRSEIAKRPIFRLDSRNKSFGSHFLLVKNCPEFINRIREELVKTGFHISDGIVQYFDKNLKNGKVSPFHKCNEFEYRQEYRFIIDSGLTVPLKIQIGSLESISEVFDIDKLDALEYSIYT